MVFSLTLFLPMILMLLILWYAYFNIFKGLEGRSYGPGAIHLSPIPGVNSDPVKFRTRAMLQEKTIYFLLRMILQNNRV